MCCDFQHVSSVLQSYENYHGARVLLLGSTSIIQQFDASSGYVLAHNYCCLVWIQLCCDGTPECRIRQLCTANIELIVDLPCVFLLSRRAITCVLYYLEPAAIILTYAAFDIF